MRSAEWKTSRTRFLVKAKQLTSALSFTDHLGRQHCGRKGDYLVESFDGVLSIAPRQIFEDIYVFMSYQEDLPSEAAIQQNDSGHDGLAVLSLRGIRIEPLEVEKIPAEKLPGRRRTDHEEPTRTRRKAPQPVRSTRAPSHLSLM